MDWINLLSLPSISWHIWLWACNKAFLLHSNGDIGTLLQTSRFLMHSPRISNSLQLYSFRGGDARFDKMTYHPGTNYYHEKASFWENSKEDSWSWGSWGTKDNQCPWPLFLFIGFEIECGHSDTEHRPQVLHRSKSENTPCLYLIDTCKI